MLVITQDLSPVEALLTGRGAADDAGLAAGTVSFVVSPRLA
ncbi:hypothetical protein [Amycolatopsis viridis]|uniref:Uncharacterized protein n=1 Tax=Amycolatopsis viridis TaxID=185678 RepID=A0ABX0STJ5_9PSEU|nr:hypothetical protein [Amycolatopsis viridis]NIH78820.1 hypothetical protein [Amycolatopsis viridis]